MILSVIKGDRKKVADFEAQKTRFERKITDLKNLVSTFGITLRGSANYSPYHYL